MVGWKTGASGGGINPSIWPPSYFFSWFENGWTCSPRAVPTVQAFTSTEWLHLDFLEINNPLLCVERLPIFSPGPWQPLPTHASSSGGAPHPWLPWEKGVPKGVLYLKELQLALLVQKWSLSKDREPLLYCSFPTCWLYYEGDHSRCNSVAALKQNLTTKKLLAPSECGFFRTWCMQVYNIPSQPASQPITMHIEGLWLLPPPLYSWSTCRSSVCKYSRLYSVSDLPGFRVSLPIEKDLIIGRKGRSQIIVAT